MSTEFARARVTSPAAGRHALSLAAVLLASGCFVTLPYTPDPGHVPNPKKTIADVMAANPTRGCLEDPPRVVGSTLRFTYVCDGGPPDVEIVRLKHVATIEVQELEGGWVPLCGGGGCGNGVCGPVNAYRVRVTHDDGTRVLWGSMRREDMERLVDALTALCLDARTPEP